MTETAPGVYEITYENISKAQRCQCKFAVNGSWIHSFGSNGQFTVGEWCDAVNGGDTIEFNTKELCNVTLRLDLNFETGEGAKYMVEITPVHTHSSTYAANGAEVTATCTAGCPEGYDTNGIKLTLNAPAELTYDGTAKAATLSGYPATPPANLAAAPTGISYYNSTGAGSTTPSGGALSGAPVNAGNYVAQFTWGDETASLAFTVAQRGLTIAMEDRTLLYSGGTLNGWSRTDAGQETVTGLVNNETVTISYTPASGKTAGTYTNGAYDTATLVIKDGGTDVTENYSLTSATAGKLTISPDSSKPLSVASADKSWTYDASVHTYKVYTVTYGTETIEGTEGQTEFTLSTGDKVTVTPTEKGANGVKNVSDTGVNSFTWEVENSGCYTKGTDNVGTLSITKADMSITIGDRELPYNGETRYGWSRTDEGKETITGLVNNETVTISYTPASGKTVGIYTNGAYDTATLIIKDGGTDVTENYSLTSATAGKLTISPDSSKPLSVASAGKSWTYDASAHTYKVYTVAYGTEKIKGTEGQTEFTLSTGDKVTITPTEKGANGVKNVSDTGANSFTWAVENEACHTKGTDTVGKLEITQYDLTITVNPQEYPYNGKQQGEGDTSYEDAAVIATKVSVGDLAEGDSIASIELDGEETAVGVYENRIELTGQEIKNSAGKTVTDNYSISRVAGKLEITKLPVTITMEDRTLPYNGGTQNGWSRTDAGKETVTGLAKNETVTISYTPASGKTAATYNGSYDTATLSIVDGSTDVTNNYNLTSATAGKLTITQSTKALVIASPSNSWEYDGSVHTDEAYTVTYDGQAVQPDDTGKVFTLPTGDTVTVTPTASGVKNVSDTAENNNTYTYVLTNEGCYSSVTANTGTLSITPKQLSDGMLTFDSVVTAPADGKAHGPSITLADGTAAMTLGEDYTLSGDTESDVFGKHSFTVAGTGNYSGTLTGNWTLQGDAENPLTYSVQEEAGAPVTVTWINESADLARSLLTPAELASLDDYKTPTSVFVKIEPLDDPTGENTKKLDALAKKRGEKVGVYLEITLWVRSGNEAPRQITDTNGKPVTLKIEVPAKIRNAPDGYSRSFSLLTVHNGEAKVVASGSGSSFTQSLTEFSPYAVSYWDTELPRGASPRTGDNSNLALWLALAAISAAGCIALVVKSKKRK